MSRNRVGRVEQHLCHVAALTEAQTSDAQLLAAFLGRRDEAAFAVLVRRYGAMVLGVCRRLLRHEADAEDAFQAVFLVLVRQAAQVRRQASLGCWLYRVAYRTALHARAAKQRRRRLEEQVPTATPDPFPETAAMKTELETLVDQELHALPAKYCDVLVLCDLLGTTKRQAAQQLHCPEGTVSSRLARARELLRKRLLRRGVTLSVGALAAALASNKAPASVTLIDTTVKAAALVAAGNLAAASGLAPQAAALLKGVLKSMLLTKLKITAGLILFFVLCGSTTTLITYRSLAGEQPASQDRLPLGAPEEKVAHAKEVEKPALDKKRFRYDGKDFLHWSDVLRYDLKPSARMEALKALLAFGTNGYADETATVIIEVMRTFDIVRQEDKANNEDAIVWYTATETLAQIGPKVFPALTKEWEKGDLNGRFFVATTLAQMGKDPEALSFLLRLVKDKDKRIRAVATRGLIVSRPKSKEAATAATQALRDKDMEVREAAVIALAQVGPVAKPVAPDLVQMILKENEPQLRLSAFDTLQRILPEPAALIPLVTTILERTNNPELVGKISGYFQSLMANRDGSFSRGQARAAVPALIAALKAANKLEATDGRTLLRGNIVDLLAWIGPPAKDAVPVLQELLNGKNAETDGKVRLAATQALEAIQAKPK